MFYYGHGSILIQYVNSCGDGSKPWYPGNLNRWDLCLFIPQNMAVIGFDPYPCKFHDYRVTTSHKKMEPLRT